MDIKNQSITQDPQTLLRMLYEGEQQEVALYNQIAQLVPSDALRGIILHMAMHEQHMAQMIPMLGQCFGVMPPVPTPPGTTPKSPPGMMPPITPGTPQPGMVNPTRNLIHTAIQTELYQIRILSDLSLMTTNEVARQIVAHLIMEEANEVIFWNTVDAAYRGIPLPGGPLYGGVYSEKGQEDKKK